MTALYLTRTNPAENMARFYKIDVQLDLFGASVVIREWGRIGRSGQVRMTPYGTRQEAEQARDRQMIKKQRRGYL